jgi:hypothetical protein
MAYVPEYEHDIFISYRRLDNKPSLFPGMNDKLEWVKDFKDNLQNKINQKLGNEETRIWMDTTDMQGNQPLDEVLKTNVKNSATLIVILSTGYLQSRYCLDELQTFTEGPAWKGRIFVVKHARLEPEDKVHPSLEQLTGYDFFDETTGDTIAPINTLYTDNLRRLRDQLSAMLKDLKQNSSSPGSAASDQNQSRQQVATVLLAEGTPDQKRELEALKEFLIQSNCKVLPEILYRRGVDDYCEQLKADLTKCELFVQYLGPYASPRAEDLPDGYEGLQLACAREAEVPRVRGCRLEAFRYRHDRNEVPEESHGRFLDAPDIIAGDLEDFKRTITDKLLEISQKKKQCTNSKNGAPSKPIYIYVQRSDEDSAMRITDILDLHKLLWEIIYFDDKISLEDVTKTLIPSGLILIYGETTDKVSLRDEVRRVRQINMNSKGEELQCALYFDPPSKREQMLLALPPFLTPLNSEDINGVHEFLGIIRAKYKSS